MLMNVHSLYVIINVCIYNYVLRSLPIGYSVIVALTCLPIGYSVIVALTGLPIGYSVIVALTCLPIGYSVIVALTGLPIGYSVIVALTVSYRIQCNSNSNITLHMTYINTVSVPLYTHM